MKIEKAYFIVKNVIDNSHRDNLYPLFATEKEVKALETIFNIVEANLDNLSEDERR